jgi:hypothetical protein
VWILLAAAFVTLLTGVINWQVGFAQKGKPRAPIVEKTETRASGAGRKPHKS